MTDTKCSGRSLHLIQEGILVDCGSTITPGAKASHEAASPASFLLNSPLFSVAGG